MTNPSQPPQSSQPPMATNPATATNPLNDDDIINVLTALAMGELEAEDAAAALDLDLDGLHALVTANPELAEQADQRAKAIQTDPDQTLAVAQRGLAAVAGTLARRVSEAPHTLTVNELTAAGSLLEKISGTAEKRKLELKSEADGDTGKSARTNALPIVIRDDRPNPVTKTPRLLIITVTPDHPAWTDFSDPAFQKPAFSWPDHHLPLSPTTGEPLREALDQLLAATGFTYLDEQGRIHGGHL